MTINQPVVSIIMPVYNGAPFLAGAIENIRQQRYGPLEIIVIDDGSTDETAAVAAQFGDEIRYVYQPNAGPAAARNRGIELAQGELIAFLDVDDLWPAAKLHHQVDVLTARPEVEIVQGLIQDMVLEDQLASFKAVDAPYYSVNLGCALYRWTVFEKVGLFDETLRWNEDTDWFIRAWEHNIQKVTEDEVALFYRKHTGNMTRGVGPLQSGLVRLFKKRLDRRRSGGNGANPLPSGGLQGFTHYIGWV